MTHNIKTYNRLSPEAIAVVNQVEQNQLVLNACGGARPCTVVSASLTSKIRNRVDKSDSCQDRDKGKCFFHRAKAGGLAG